jgi:hypothetical protein
MKNMKNALMVLCVSLLCVGTVYATTQWRSKTISVVCDSSNIPEEAEQCYVTVKFLIWEQGNPSNSVGDDFYVKLDNLNSMEEVFSILLNSSSNYGWTGSVAIYPQYVGLGSDGEEYHITYATYDYETKNDSSGYPGIAYLLLAPDVTKVAN